MRNHIIRLLALFIALTVVACGGEAGDLDAETAEAVDQVEDELTQLGEEIDASEMQGDLESAWDGVEEEVSEAVDSIRSGETIDTDAIEQQLDQFEETLQSVNAEEDLQNAWNELRANLEGILADIG